MRQSRCFCAIFKAEVEADLDNRINKADTGIKGEYYSVNARGKEKLIADDLGAISNKLAEEYAKNNEVSIEEAKTAVGDIKAYSGELSDAGRQNLAKTKKALNALNKLGNSGVSLVVMDNVAKDGNITTNGTIIGDRIYMTAEAIESGKWAKTLVHEYTHFEEGTEEYKRLVSHLLEDKALFESADADVTDANYSPDIETYSSEVAAKMSESLLGNEHFINKLVKQDASLAEKLANTNPNRIRPKPYKSALFSGFSFIKSALYFTLIRKKSSNFYRLLVLRIFKEQIFLKKR